MKISDTFKIEIKAANDIVSAIGETVALEKQGSVYVGLCPFLHEGARESTPSLTVYPDNQSYYCYGCGAGNKQAQHGGSSDVIGWVQNLHGLSFVDACRHLADRANLSWPTNDQPSDPGQTALIQETTNRNRLYHQHLLNQPEILEYLQGRGLTDETIRLGRLGLVPQDDPRPEIRGRLAIGIPGMPNPDGTIPTVSLAYRILKGSGPTYLNDPNDRIFTKGQMLYLLPHAMGPMKQTGVAVLVEGYFDALMLHQRGVTHAVAAMGTSLTETQVRLLRRYTDQVYLWMDNDAAGIMATKRALPLLLAEGFSIKVVLLFDKDPAESMRRVAENSWECIQSHSQDGVNWFIDQLARKYDEVTLSTRLSTYQSGMNVLDKIPDPIRREVYRSQLRHRLEMAS